MSEEIIVIVEDEQEEVSLFISEGDSGGIEEAPVDTMPYARQDAAWVEIDKNIDGGNAESIYLITQTINGGNA